MELNGNMSRGGRSGGGRGGHSGGGRGGDRGGFNSDNKVS